MNQTFTEFKLESMVGGELIIAKPAVEANSPVYISTEAVQVYIMGKEPGDIACYSYVLDVTREDSLKDASEGNGQARRNVVEPLITESPVSLLADDPFGVYSRQMAIEGLEKSPVVDTTRQAEALLDYCLETGWFESVDDGIQLLVEPSELADGDEIPNLRRAITAICCAEALEIVQTCLEDAQEFLEDIAEAEDEDVARKIQRIQNIKSITNAEISELEQPASWQQLSEKTELLDILGEVLQQCSDIESAVYPEEELKAITKLLDMELLSPGLITMDEQESKSTAELMQEISEIVDQADKAAETMDVPDVETPDDNLSTNTIDDKTSADTSTMNLYPVFTESIPTSVIKVGESKIGPETTTVKIEHQGMSAYVYAEPVSDSIVNEIRDNVRLHPNFEEIFDRFDHGSPFRLHTDVDKQDVPECYSATIATHDLDPDYLKEFLQDEEFLLHPIEEVISVNNELQTFEVVELSPERHTTLQVTNNTDIKFI